MVQETLVRAYFGSAKFTPRASVKTWLYAIASNLSRDHVRRLIRQRLAVPIDVDRDAPAIEIADAGRLANEAAGKRDEFTLLQRAMDRLPTNCAKHWSCFRWTINRRLHC